MGIFGGEKYSKEGYEEAKKQEDSDYEFIKKDSLAGWGLSEEAKQRIYDKIWVDAGSARDRMRNLRGKGQVEATALNEEYDLLLDRASEAIKAVADFEREKLGMHKEGAEEAEADADKK